MDRKVEAVDPVAPVEPVRARRVLPKGPKGQDEAPRKRWKEVLQESLDREDRGQDQEEPEERRRDRFEPQEAPGPSAGRPHPEPLPEPVDPQHREALMRALAEHPETFLEIHRLQRYLQGRLLDSKG